jgi:hypothetical protein
LFAFFFFVFSFGAVCVWGVGFGGGFGSLFHFFLFSLWLVVLFLLSLFLLLLRGCWVPLLRSVFAVLVPLFRPCPFGRGCSVPFLVLFLFPAVVWVVCVPLLVPRFLPLLCSVLPLSVVVVRGSLVVRWRSFSLLLLPLVRFGFLFLLALVPLGLFRPLPLLAASRGLVRVRGLPLLLLRGWAFLCLFGFLLGLFLLLRGALFRWVVASSIAPSLVIINFCNMVHVPNFVCGAYASRKAALSNLRFLQPQSSVRLKIIRVWHIDTHLFFIVY